MKTCSVIVCAHNEERAIGRLLADVFAQHIPEGWILREVCIIADGCRDGTEEVVRRFALDHPYVRLLSLPFPNRGKSRAFNEGIATLSDDAVVMFDADVRLANENVLTKLLEAIVGGGVLVSGNDVPDPAPVHTIGHAASIGRHLIKQALKRRVGGVYTCVGRVLAMRREFYRGLEVPDLPGEDNFRYFTAQLRGQAYRYVPSAVVFFTAARTLRDYALQHARFWHGVDAFRIQFGSRAQYGSLDTYVRVTASELCRHPLIMSAWAIGAAYGHLVYWWQRYAVRLPQTGRWEVASSTK